MATWSIEHIPAAGGDPTIASLATWGFAGVQIQFENWGKDMAAITARGGTIAFDAAQFAYKDKIIIWRDGVRFFHGWVTGLGLTAQAQESRTYTISGPSWWLEHLPFTWPTWPAKEELSLGERASFRWIGFALDAAIAKGAPIAKDSGNYAPFILPTPDIRASSNCLEVLQRVARLHPMSAGFWDYSGETPIFRAVLRAGLTPTTIALGTDAVETLGFTPLPDQQVESVHIGYNYTDDYGTHTVHNTAGDTPYGYGPNKLHISVDVDTAALASEAQSAGIAPLLYASLSPLAWSGAVNLHETSASLPVVLPGNALSVTGGRAEWETMSTVVQTVVWSVSDAANDLCTITIGPPERLGPQDYLEFARAGTLAASSAANNPSPWEPPTPPTIDPGDPGTYDDLNGSTGGGTPEGIIAVQARGGSWSLGGYSSFDGSAPTRRWLRADMAYSVTYDCGGGADTETRSAYGVYDPANFAAGPSGENLSSLNGWSSDGFFCSDFFPYVKSATTATATATPGTYVSIGFCCGSQYPYTLISGSDVQTLSSEYTADDAIARLLAGSPEWGATTTAIRTIPMTGITGLYREARYRTEHTAGDPAVTTPTLIGLSPWQRYQLTVTLESRPVDEAGTPTGDWAAAGTRRHYFIADITGEGGIDWQIVEPTAGYETRVASTLLEVA